MTSTRCERSREAVSLRLDGALSAFESALLARHLRECTACEAFAKSVDGETALLRRAPLDPIALPVALEPARRSRPRRPTIFLGACAAAAAAAFVVAPGPGGSPTAAPRPEVIAAVRAPSIDLVTAKPSANATFEVPRLRARFVSPDARLQWLFDELA